MVFLIYYTNRNCNKKLCYYYLHFVNWKIFNSVI